MVGWSVGLLVVSWLVRWSIPHAGFTEVMQQIWDGLTANYLCSVHASTQRRMQMVIEAKGSISVRGFVGPSVCLSVYQATFLMAENAQIFHIIIDHP